MIEIKSILKIVVILSISKHLNCFYQFDSYQPYFDLVGELDQPIRYAENVVVGSVTYEAIETTNQDVLEKDLKTLEEMIQVDQERFIDHLFQKHDERPLEWKAKEKLETASDLNVLTIVLVVAPILLSILLGVAIIILRKRQNKKDDEETLVKGNLEKPKVRKFRPSNLVKILKRSPIGGGNKTSDVSPSREYQDLCRQRMESSTENSSPMSSTLCTNLTMNTPGLSGINSSTINSTPIKMTNDEKNES